MHKIILFSWLAINFSVMASEGKYHHLADIDVAGALNSGDVRSIARLKEQKQLPEDTITLLREGGYRDLANSLSGAIQWFLSTLISLQAKTEAINRHKEPLFFGAYWGDVARIKDALKKVTIYDPSIKDRGETAAEVAEARDYHKLASFLRREDGKFRDGEIADINDEIIKINIQRLFEEGRDKGNLLSWPVFQKMSTEELSQQFEGSYFALLVKKKWIKNGKHWNLLDRKNLMLKIVDIKGHSNADAKIIAKFNKKLLLAIRNSDIVSMNELILGGVGLDVEIKNGHTPTEYLASKNLLALACAMQHKILWSLFDLNRLISYERQRVINAHLDFWGV